MDPQQPTSNPAETSTENEHREAGYSSEQPAPLSQRAPQSAPLQEETTQGPFRQQSPFSEFSRPLQGPVPLIARPTSSNTFSYGEKPEVEAMPGSGLHKGALGDVPVDARVSRHATLRAPMTGERVYTGLNAARRSTIDYLVPVEPQVSFFNKVRWDSATFSIFKLNIRMSGNV